MSSAINFFTDFSVESEHGLLESDQHVVDQVVPHSSPVRRVSVLDRHDHIPRNARVVCMPFSFEYQLLHVLGSLRHHNAVVKGYIMDFDSVTCPCP